MTQLTYSFREQAAKERQARRERLRQIPYEYADFLEKRPPGYVVSQRLLPHPKGEIIEALLFSIANAKSQVEKQLLCATLTTLAYFQDIGECDSIAPPDIGQFDLASKPEAKRYLESSRESAPEFEAARAKVQDDIRLFASWKAKAIGANEYLWPPLKRWWKRLTDPAPVLLGRPDWIDFPN